MRDKKKKRFRTPAFATLGERESADRLFVVRESAVSDRLLMEGMIHQTLQPYIDLPGVSDVLELGLDALDGTDVPDRAVIRHGGSKVVVLWRGGNYFLLSMASAASTIGGDSSDNAFVQVLSEVLEILAPTHLHVATFSRLVRAAEFSGSLMKAAQANVEYVHLGARTFHPRSDEGRTQWQVLTLISDQERRSILQRLVVGQLNKARKGEWISGDLGYPPGYRLVDGVLMVHEPEVEATRQMLEILAQEDLPAWRACELIGELGLSTPKLRKMLHQQTGVDPDSVTAADARNPWSLVQTLRGWTDLYRTGQYRRRWPNPFPGATTLAGYPVRHGLDPDHPDGSFELVYEPGVPEGGWASPETFAGVEHRRTPRPTGGAAARALKPLLGIPEWESGTHTYRLASEHSRYLLVRRPIGSTGSWRDRRNAWDAERVATVDCAALHSSLARGIATALTQGVAVEPVTGLSIEVDLDSLSMFRRSLTDHVAAVDNEIKDLKRLHANALRNANNSNDADTAAGFIESAGQLSRRLRDAEQRRVDLMADKERPDIPDDLRADPRFLIEAIGRLATVRGSVDARLSHALSTILTDFKLAADAYEVSWETSLLLPTDDKIVKLGPIRGKVSTASVKSTAMVGDRDGELLERFMLGASLGELAELRRTGVDHVRRVLYSELSQHELTGEAVSALVGCPIPETRRAVWMALNGSRPELDAFDAHIAETYVTEAFGWTGNRWRYVGGKRQAILDDLAALGGRAAPKALADVCGVRRQYILTMARRRVTGAVKGSTFPATLDRVAVASDGHLRITEVRLFDCPHCGGHASRLVRVPEVPLALLCPACRRMPVNDSPEFPPGYLD